MIRPLKLTDVDYLRELHEKHFEQEFEFPHFFKNFICAVAAEDSDGKIICAGGTRTIAEIVVVTDKTKSPRERRKALYEVLSASMYFAEKTGHDSLHAFINNNPEWMHQLRKAGFIDCNGKPLYIPIGR
jgi:hypothetical protein